MKLLVILGDDVAIDLNDVEAMKTILTHKAFNWGRDCVIEWRFLENENRGKLYCMKCKKFIE